MPTETPPATLQTMPNERRQVEMRLKHTVPLPSCCPVSKNPGPGSTLTVSYHAKTSVLEVYSLQRFIGRYVGGSPEGTRTMEAMIQEIAAACAAAVGVPVKVTARVRLQTGRLRIRCHASP